MLKQIVRGLSAVTVMFLLLFSVSFGLVDKAHAAVLPNAQIVIAQATAAPTSIEEDEAVEAAAKAAQKAEKKAAKEAKKAAELVEKKAKEEKKAEEKKAKEAMKLEAKKLKEAKKAEEKKAKAEAKAAAASEITTAEPAS
jgi:outer membrane biosynthesis protein TonB